MPFQLSNRVSGTRMGPSLSSERRKLVSKFICSKLRCRSPQLATRLCAALCRATPTCSQLLLPWRVRTLRNPLPADKSTTLTHRRWLGHASRESVRTPTRQMMMTVRAVRAAALPTVVRAIGNVVTMTMPTHMAPRRQAQATNLPIANLLDDGARSRGRVAILAEGRRARLDTRKPTLALYPKASPLLRSSLDGRRNY